MLFRGCLLRTAVFLATSGYQSVKIFSCFRFLYQFLIFWPVLPFTMSLSADQFMGNRLCWVLCGWPVLQKEIKCHSAIHRTLIIRWSASLVWPRCSLVCYPQETRLASIANETIETHNHSSRDLVARAGDHCLFCSLLPFVKRKPHYLVWSFPVNI